MRAPVGVKEEHAAISPSNPAGGLENGGAAPAVQAALKKGPWTPAEDAILLDYVRKNGEGNWNAVQKNSGLQRCGKSCRLRWANHLRPNLKKGSFSPEEEALILQLHARLGNKWARMAAQLPGRTDNEIKNYWNTRIKRRQRAGLPLYPAEIQRQITLKNQKQGIAISQACTTQHSLLDSTTFSPPAVALPLLPQNPISSFLQDPTQLKNFLDSSCSFHPPLTTVSPVAATLFPNGAALHAFRDIELSPPLLAQSPAYSEKTELPSTQLFANTGGVIQLPVPSMGQGNCGLLDALLQETQGVGELFKDGLLFEPLPPPASKSSVMDPLCKLGCSHCSDEILLKEEAVQKPVAAIPALLDMTPTPAQATVAPAETVICNGDGCELSNGQSSEVTSDDLSLEMQQLASTLSMAHDWGFGSCSWDNMPSIC